MMKLHPRMTPFLWASCLPVILCVAGRVVAQEPEVAVIYRTQCATCHESSAKTAPDRAAMRLMSPENILLSLESGRMKDQGSLLTPQQRRSLAEFVAGSPLGQTRQPPQAGLCDSSRTPFAPSSTDWNGWGADLTNSRFQPGKRAGLTAEQVPRLKLKWAFVFPKARMAWGQPSVVGGRIFVPSVNRLVYSLDASSGCQYWAYETEAPAR